MHSRGARDGMWERVDVMYIEARYRAELGGAGWGETEIREYGKSRKTPIFGISDINLIRSVGRNLWC